MRNVLAAAVLLLALPAHADGYDRISDRGAFVGLVDGKTLRSLGVSLVVTATGQIGGRAFGRDITGAWIWDGGLFCRTMQAGDAPLPATARLWNGRATASVSSPTGARAMWPI